MALNKHLRILRQKVKVWNHWRKDNPKIKPDLSNADLSGAELSNFNLSRANLSGANLSGANLSGANLSDANFSNADLNNTDLSYAMLSGADLGNVTLSNVNLSGVDLSGRDFTEKNLGNADFSNADLSGTDLSGTDLSGTDLSGTDLSGANISNANLSGTILSKVDLSKVDLSKVDLSKANLSGAYISNANLSGADLSRRDFTGEDLSGVCFVNTNLQRACLINAKLDGANLTGAHLWETQRSGWSIKGIICEYIYWDKDGREKTKYAPGEFERLYASQTKIKLFFKKGISPIEITMLPALIQHLEDTQDCSLRLVSINEGAGGAVVEVAIEEGENFDKEQIKQLQAALEKEAQQQVEYQRKALKEREKRLELEGEVKQLSIFVDKLIQRPNVKIKKSKGDIKMSDDKSSKYTNTGYVGAMGDNAQAHNVNFNQPVNNVGESIDLVALATELATLRVEIAKMQDSSPQAMLAAGEIVRAEIAAGEKDTPKVLGHLKAAGQWALDAATKVGTTIVAEVIKKSMGL